MIFYPNLVCPNCDCKVEFEDNYTTIFRCPRCQIVGNKQDFIWIYGGKDEIERIQ